jgi:hypothetical protein
MLSRRSAAEPRRKPLFEGFPALADDRRRKTYTAPRGIDRSPRAVNRKWLRADGYDGNRRERDGHGDDRRERHRRVRRIHRNVLLAVTCVAFSWMQVPLCALACLDTTETEVAHAPEAGCHQAAGDDRSPAPSSHEDCAGCELADGAPLRISDFLSASGTLPFARVASSTSLPRPSVRFASRLTARVELPSPDILLLNSTLIL